MEELRKAIREVPDFPKPGILFYDITTLLRDRRAFAKTIDLFAERYIGERVDAVVCIEARGFILGAALAYRLGAGFIPIRKPGKLPARTIQENYALEYGTDSIEMHDDPIEKGQQVILVDDLLATGGTAAAACRLVERTGGQILECCFLVELVGLRGRARLGGRPAFSLIQYES
ncbi:MAG: adenine phosphoribosyltransferase [bacterium]